MGSLKWQRSKGLNEYFSAAVRAEKPDRTDGVNMSWCSSVTINKKVLVIK